MVAKKKVSSEMSIKPGNGALHTLRDTGLNIELYRRPPSLS